MARSSGPCVAAHGVHFLCNIRSLPIPFRISQGLFLMPLITMGLWRGGRPTKLWRSWWPVWPLTGVRLHAEVMWLSPPSMRLAPPRLVHQGVSEGDEGCHGRCSVYPRIFSTEVSDFICKTPTQVPFLCNQGTLAAGGACSPLAVMPKFPNHYAPISAMMLREVYSRHAWGDRAPGAGWTSRR
jgi:hypothetical protein